MSKKIVAFRALLAILFFAGGCEQPVKFGVVADIQYHPGKPLGTRYYSASLDKLKEALAQFDGEKVQFVVNLGDTIDHDIQTFDGLMPLFKGAKVPVHHVTGNHDFDVEAKPRIESCPRSGWRRVITVFPREVGSSSSWTGLNSVILTRPMKPLEENPKPSTRGSARRGRRMPNVGTEASAGIRSFGWSVNSKKPREPKRGSSSYAISLPGPKTRTTSGITRKSSPSWSGTARPRPTSPAITTPEAMPSRTASIT
jgi:hypothetical protein